MLFWSANLILAFAFVAEESNIQIPFDMFATDARIKKWAGKPRVRNSNPTARLRNKGALNHQRLTSASKFWPIFPDNKITPNYPNPSFSTQFKAADSKVASVIVEPNATNNTCVEMKLSMFVDRKLT